MKQRLKPGENGGQSVDECGSPGKRCWWLKKQGAVDAFQGSPRQGAATAQFVLRGWHMAKEKAPGAGRRQDWEVAQGFPCPRLMCGIQAPSPVKGATGA